MWNFCELIRNGEKEKEDLTVVEDAASNISVVFDDEEKKAKEHIVFGNRRNPTHARIDTPFFSQNNY